MIGRNLWRTVTVGSSLLGEIVAVAYDPCAGWTILVCDDSGRLHDVTRTDDLWVE